MVYPAVSSQLWTRHRDDRTDLVFFVFQRMGVE